MLIEFRVENHRSIRDEQTLTMESGRGGDEKDLRPRHLEGYPEALLPVAVLYGANASGKSTILAALAFMRYAVLESHRRWAPDEGIPREPFAWGPKKHEPSLYEVSVLIKGIRYQFGFVASDEGFLEEWLHAWPHGKKQVWYERDKNVFKFGENLKGENKVIEEVTRPNALFLSAAVQLKHVQLQPIYSWFRSLSPVKIQVGRLPFYPSNEGLQQIVLTEALYQSTSSLFQDEPPLKQFREMLKNADIGILDVRLVEDGSNHEKSGRAGRQIQLKHRNSFENAWLPLEEESKGTQTLFRIGLPILQAIREGSLVLVDELEGSMHPSLAQQIVEWFNNPASNARGAQLLFTTHDTNLLGTTLGEPALRRDQVWLTEKDPEGATILYPLTNYKPRKAENLERGYLQGRYGAVPFLGNLTATDR